MTISNAPLTGVLYTPGTVPSDPAALTTFLTLELRKISQSISKLTNTSPQVANTAPVRPQAGWIRYAVAPWNPLNVQSGDSGWVQFTNNQWQAFTP